MTDKSQHKVSSPYISRVPTHKLRDYIAEQLQEIRQSTSWKQTEIADELRRTQGQVSRYEQGQRDIPAHDLAQLARLLQVPVQEFFPPDVWDQLEPDEVRVVQLLRKKDYQGLLRFIADQM